jgi:hypothetical protein
MHAREHMYWSFVMYSIVMYIYTSIIGVRDLDWGWHAILLVLLVISVVLNDLSNVIYSRLKKINANRSTGEDGKKVKKQKATRKERLTSISLRLSSYSFLFLVTAFTSYVAMPITDTSIIIVVGYMTALCGAWVPDFDTMLADISFHRHPLTHSAMFYTPVALWAILVCPVQFTWVLIAIVAFLIGGASHMLCDQFKSGETLDDAFFGFFTFKTSPGNIREIRSDRERHWLFIQLGFFVFWILISWFRVNLSSFMTYVPVWDGTTVTMSTVPTILISIAGAYYGFMLMLFLAWPEKKKKKTSTKKKKEIVQSKL